MRRIEKAGEPACLAKLQNTPGANWTSVHGDQKQQMRAQAWREQAGLCAYCMTRVWPRETSMKVEHSRTQKEHPDQIFHWPNLLGVCLGVVSPEGRREDRFHCDAFREDRALHVNPAAFPPDAGTLFGFTHTGEVRPAAGLDAATKEKVEETISNLNLNHARLKRNRASVLQTLSKQLRRSIPPAALLKSAQQKQTDGSLGEYVGVATQYLKKKLRQAG